MRNAFLLAASLVFYAWGEPFYVLLMILSILFNFLVGRRLETPVASHRRWLLAGVAGNLLVLGHFKYSNFLVDNFNLALAWLHLPEVAHEPVQLPIGISFFTFHAISYLVDIHRGRVKAETSLIDLGLYIAMFPQLVAGPIIRYADIAAQIRDRTVTLGLFSDGVARFVLGLGKKMLLANPCGEIADAAFGEPPATLGPGMAWLGIVAYAFQIYFDFSGYSDMAIGLGKMFGFRYLENFDHPYIARSLREFWRRWHISLSTWFRDYLYIPLGGNRRGRGREYLNLVIVFSLCGLWHGASWNFLIWGWMHGLFLALERTRFGLVIERAWAPLGHLYALLVVLVAWVFFRAESPAQALSYLYVMLGAGEAGTHDFLPAPYATPYHWLLLTTCAVAAMPAGRNLVRAVLASQDRRTGTAGPVLVAGARLAGLCTLGLLAAGYVAADTYNPFIYFRF